MLRCDDCKREYARNESGWIDFVPQDDREAGEHVVIYCPDCASARFKDNRPRTTGKPG